MVVKIYYTNTFLIYPSSSIFLREIQRSENVMRTNMKPVVTRLFMEFGT